MADFAARRHARSEQANFSMEAMLTDNYFNSHRLMELVAQMQLKHAFSVSPNMMANPVNIVGVTTNLTEDMPLAYSVTLPITSARFANAAYSKVSLLLAYLKRVGKDQLLSAPNGARYYFVPSVESGEICPAVCLLGKPGEIFFPIFDEAAYALQCSDIAMTMLGALGLGARICESEENTRGAPANRSEQADWYSQYFFASDTTGEDSIETFHVQTEEVDLAWFPALGSLIPTKSPKGGDTLTFVDELRSMFSGRSLEKSVVLKALADYFADFSNMKTAKTLNART